MQFTWKMDISFIARGDTLYCEGKWRVRCNTPINKDNFAAKHVTGFILFNFDVSLT
jgi:hypothetical protein